MADQATKPRRSGAKRSLAQRAVEIDREIRRTMADSDLGEMDRDARVAKLQAEYYLIRASQCIKANNPRAEREHRKEAREWMQRHTVAMGNIANDLIVKIAEQQENDDQLYQAFVAATDEEADETDKGAPA